MSSSPMIPLPTPVPSGYAPSTAMAKVCVNATYILTVLPPTVWRERTTVTVGDAGPGPPPPAAACVKGRGKK
jgi:hypothetical protein